MCMNSVRISGVFSVSAHEVRSPLWGYVKHAFTFSLHMFAALHCFLLKDGHKIAIRLFIKLLELFDLLKTDLIEVL